MNNGVVTRSDPASCGVGRADLEGQLLDPRHCHLELAPGRLFCHGPASVSAKEGEGLPREMVGTPVRFTRIAAERVAAQLRRFHPKVKVVEIPAAVSGKHTGT